MTYPLPTDPPERKRANWLGRYLTVEGEFDDRLKGILSQAATDVGDAFGDLREDLFSAKVRRVQVAQSRKAIRGIVRRIFGDETDIIREHQQDAAMAAVGASLYDQRGILGSIFKKPAELQSYARSLEQTAARNIDAVMTRVLETEKPLSARVYHTQALAQGMVDRAINKTLATGGSAKDLAKSVEALIDPRTPGGVSYAARRLGRTEINNAFHAQSIHDAQSVPWLNEMEWHLSKVHVTDPGDECEEYALQQYFPTESVPEKPHPHCRCYVTPRVPDRETFTAAVDSGQYDTYLDQFIAGDTEPPALPRIDDAFSVSVSDQEIEDITSSSVDYKKPIKATPASKVSDAVKKQPLAEIESISDAIAEAKRRHEINISGMEYVDPEGVSQVFEFVEKYKTQYPKIPLRSISVRQLNVEGAQAVTHMGDPKNITIDIDRKWISNYSLAKSNGQEDMGNGHFAKGTHDRPFYGVLVHEYGHVIHASVGGKDQIYLGAPDLDNDPGFALHNAWQADEKDKSKDLNEYIEKHLSGYSFDRYDTYTKVKMNFNDSEALAEAFVKVEVAPKTANSAQKALHKFLVDKVKK